VAKVQVEPLVAPDPHYLGSDNRVVALVLFLISKKKVNPAALFTVSAQIR
jgi:hypothetical protein